MTLTLEQGFPYGRVRGPILRGRGLAAQGQRAEGLAYMQQGLAAWRATGQGFESYFFLHRWPRCMDRGDSPRPGWRLGRNFAARGQGWGAVW